MAEEVQEEQGGLRSHMYKHEAMVAWINEQEGVDLDTMTAAEVIAYAFAKRVAWRQSDEYKQAIAEHAEAVEAEKAERQAAREAERAEKAAAKEAEKAAKEAAKAEGDGTAPKATKTAAKSTKATKASKASKATAKASVGDSPFD